MQCDGKHQHATERAALNELKRFRRNRHQETGLKDMNAYLCPRCHFWHIGHDTDGRKAREVKVSAGEIRKLKRRVEDVGRRIANDELRAAQKRVRELAPIVAEDREWLRRMKDAAEYHEACAEALRKMLDAHFLDQPKADCQ